LYNSKVTSLTIPASVTSFGSDPFGSGGCNSPLTTVTFAPGSQITSIDNNMFSCSVSLTSLTIPPSVTSIGSNAFAYTFALTSISIPANVTSLGDFAFSQSGLTTITFESGSQLASIGQQAFMGATRLTSITIPASVTTIGASAFSNAPFFNPPGTLSLTAINVDPANPNYSSIDGVLFDKNATTLIQYPSRKSNTTYSIPSGVTSIGLQAFSRAINLTSVTIPASVTTIGEGAFRLTTALTSVTIPANVTSIGSSAFGGASSLSGVAFSGNTAPTIGSDAFLSVASSATAYIKSGATGFTTSGSPARWNRLAVAFIYEGVSFNSNGGTAIATGDYLGSITAPTAPTKPGYAFVGWTETDGGETTVSFPYAPVALSAITLHAKWTVGTYDVTYDSKGGTAVTSGTFNTGGNFAAPTAPTKAGYTFVGWTATDGAETTVDFPYAPGVIEGITLYAKWSIATFAVAFNSKGGTAVSNGSFTLLTDVAEPTEPTRAGYTFAGWTATDGAETTVDFPYTPSETSNITLYAKWTANTYAVNWNSKSGTAVTSGTFNTGGNFGAPTSPTRTGYTFAGWTAADGGSVTVAFPYAPSETSNITLYAKWNLVTHVVTYDSKGGSAVPNGSFSILTNVSQPTAPTKEDYSFLGWTETDGGSAIVSFPYTPSAPGAITLYAKWLLVPPFKAVLTGSPKITGTAAQNTNLTSTTGTWSALPRAVITFQWYRCDNKTLAGQADFTAAMNCKRISGATKDNYKVTLADQSKYLAVLTKATNKMGSTFSTARSILVPKATAPVLKSAPRISGAATKGSTLTASAGTWTANPTPTTTLQWYRCENSVSASTSSFSGSQDCVKIPGATKAQYRIATADQGLHLTALVSGKNSQGVVAESAKSIKVPGTKPTKKSNPSISGKATAGSALRVSSGTWSAIPEETTTQAWYRCSKAVVAGATSISSGMGCTKISGASGSSYTVKAADQGKHITALVTAKNSEGNASSSAASVFVKVPVTTP
jgi:uncharacterized repeat protein (TIGR02543 family)